MTDPKHRIHPLNCFLCNSQEQEIIQTFCSPPEGENTFGVKNYYRELWRCKNCGLFSNRHELDLSSIYEGAYREAAYCGDQVRDKFHRIMALPPENSDNRLRVKRIIEWMSKYRLNERHHVLDIGSGMAVFPAAMREAGWRAVAIDPDLNNVKHAQEIAKVEAVQGHFPNIDLNEIFPLITFNKVLEHIENISECLAGAKRNLTQEGIVYIELPDGESAIDKGPRRQEFFLEHYYIFSAASIALLATRSGFRLQSLERVQDPSGKFTLAAFLSSSH